MINHLTWPFESKFCEQGNQTFFYSDYLILTLLIICFFDIINIAAGLTYTTINRQVPCTPHRHLLEPVTDQSFTFFL